MPWAALDDSFHDDPRLVEAGIAASGLYARCTTYCARHLTDGIVSAKALYRLLDDGDAAPLAALVNAGMLRPSGQRFEVVDYFPANRSREQVQAAKAKAAKAARARWTPDAPSIADAMPSSPLPSHPLPSTPVTEPATCSTGDHSGSEFNGEPAW